MFYNEYKEFVKMFLFKSNIDSKMIYINLHEIVAIEIIKSESTYQLKIICKSGQCFIIDYKELKDCFKEINNAFNNKKEENEK